MIQDLIFDEIELEVRRVCSKMNYTCSFLRSLGCFKVYGQLNCLGHPFITDTLIKSICLVSYVHFVSVAVDNDNKLYALFDIDEVL